MKISKTHTHALIFSLQHSLKKAEILDCNNLIQNGSLQPLLLKSGVVSFICILFTYFASNKNR